MNTSTVELDARATEVRVGPDSIEADLIDGRLIRVPLAWFPRLLKATEPQRQHFELLGDGVGVHWPQIDEDLSIAGFLRVMQPER